VVLKRRGKKHRADITDPDLPDEELIDFIKSTKLVAKHIKQAVRNEEGQSAGRIYVCTLCDGVEHLHAHLIPRYPYTGEDENTYEQLFLERDGRKQINGKIETGDLGGFWYIAEREKSYTKSDYWRRTAEERAKYLEDLAQHLRISAGQ
jgi:diadenosine tetraphosphate (Ap4A) HIT family hydrolase